MAAHGGGGMTLEDDVESMLSEHFNESNDNHRQLNS